MPSDKETRYQEKRRRSRSRSKERSKRRRSRERRRSRSYDKASKLKMRRKPSRYWDIPPPGYEHVTPLQFKEMQAAGHIPANALTLSGTATLPGNTVARQARRLFVGNIPFACNPEDMKDFFNEQIHACGLAQTEGNPVLACHINFDKNFAFLEFRSTEETTLTMRNLDGINYQGQALRLRRPQDYQPPPGEQDPVPYNAWGSQDSPHNLYIGGIPNYFTKEQVMELLIPFGKLKTFDLLMDSTTFLNRGFAFAEYEDITVTDLAIEGLNGLVVGEKTLAVRRARTGGKFTDSNMLLQTPVTVQVPGISQVVGPGPATEVLCLMSILEPKDLEDDEDYDDIMDDIRQQCEAYGKVLSMEIPRPIPGVEVPGCGKVFVEFDTVEACQRALHNLTGRKFNNRVVVTSFYDPDKYHRREF